MLAVKKNNDTYCLNQNLQIVNEATIPLHPMVPDPSYFCEKYPQIAAGSQF